MVVRGKGWELFLSFFFPSSSARFFFSLSPASLGHKEASICVRFVLLSTFQPEMSETQTVEYYIGKAYAIGSNP